MCIFLNQISFNFSFGRVRFYTTAFILKCIKRLYRTMNYLQLSPDFAGKLYEHTGPTVNSSTLWNITTWFL